MTFHSLRFNRAAPTYEAHARIQTAMAETLIGLFPEAENDRVRSGRVLEMGCGTGLFTRRLRARFPDAPLTATDAAPRMIETAHASLSGEPPAGANAHSSTPVRWEIFEASGESPVPAAVRDGAPFALAGSSALVQWFPELERHFAMVGSLLAPGGSYLVSGFARDNFPELNAILREPPFSYPDYPGHTAAGIRIAAEAAGLAVESFREDSLAFTHPSPKDFLDSIRGLGSARRPEAESPLTRSRLRHLLARYQERYAGPGGVIATWKPWYARLRMPF